MPKKIPSYLFLDFVLASAGYFLCLVALRPYKFSTWRITDSTGSYLRHSGCSAWCAPP